MNHFIETSAFQNQAQYMEPSLGITKKSDKKKMHVLENELLMKIFFCGKIVHLILLTKTGCAPTSLRMVNLSTINCDAVDWTTYLQSSVRGGGFYKDFAVMLRTHRKNSCCTKLRVETFSKAHSSNSLRKSMLSTNTVFHPSGSVHAVILVLMPGNGPGSRVICPPFSRITSAVL